MSSNQASKSNQLLLGMNIVFWLWHVFAVLFICLTQPKILSIYTDILGEDAQFPMLTGWFMGSSVPLFFVTAILLIWLVCYGVRACSNLNGILLLVTLILFSVILIVLYGFSMLIPMVKITTGLSFVM